MNEQSLGNRAREIAKLSLRRALLRADLDLVRDPWTARVTRMARARGITALLDVGANVGQYAALMRAAGFEGRIVSVEPLSGAHTQLARRAAKDRQWDTVHAAVGPDAAATIHVSANSYSSSVLELSQEHLDVAPDSAVIGEETVPMLSVSQLVAQHDLDPERTLLKVDTQGYEASVLNSAVDLLDRFAAVQLELSLVELYQGQALMDDLVARLASHHLPLYAAAPGISNPEGRMLQMDGLFVRDAH